MEAMHLQCLPIKILRVRGVRCRPFTEEKKNREEEKSQGSMSHDFYMGTQNGSKLEI
jgi:hypothetical protein